MNSKKKFLLFFKMAEQILNWLGTVFIIVALVLLFVAYIYVESIGKLNDVFRWLSIIGLILGLAGLLTVVGAHWNVFFKSNSEMQTFTYKRKMPVGVPY